jgi:transcriptional regulator with GAF, ATPase, and Fis domain
MSEKDQNIAKKWNFEDPGQPDFKGSLQESLQKELEEQEILLSFNNDIASIRNKKDILDILQPKLKQLFGTGDVFICVFDRDRQTLNPLLRTAGEKRRKYKGYEEMMNSDFPVADGFIDTILRTGKPLIFDLTEVNAWPVPPYYIKTFLAAGLTESLSKTLYQGEEPIGILTFWSERKGDFTSYHEKLIQKVADQVSLLVSNISDNETIRQKEKENEILLLISNKIAAIRNKEDLSSILSGILKKYLSFDDSAITVYDYKKKTYRIYSHHSEKKRREHPDFQAALNAEYPLDDKNLLRFHTPVVLDVETLLKNGKSQVSFIYEAGIKEFATIKLVDGDNLIGVFTLLSERKNSFTASSLNIMQRISYQFSIAVAKLLAIEELRNREQEKEILLTVGNELAAIRDKEDLLPLLKKQLENLSFYSDVTIAKVDRDGRTFSAFLVNEDSIRQNHQGYPKMRSAHHFFPDGVFEIALHSKKPVIFDIGEIVKRTDTPSYVKFLYENNTIDMAGISLRDRNREIGALFLFSDKKQSFSELQLSLVQGIGNLLGTAVANILANEEIKTRESEKTILLSLSNEIATVRNKNDLFAVVNTKLKKLFSVSGFGIALISEDGKTHSPFLFGIEKEISGHPDFNSIISRKYSVEDSIFNLIIHSADPVILNVQELPEGPAYVNFWKQLGILEIAGVALRVGDHDLGCLFFYTEGDEVNKISMNLLKGVCAQISIALSNILANEKITRQLAEISRYKEQLEEEKLYLQEEVSGGYTYTDIIGNGPEMQKVFQLLSQVSFADSTVLLLGETGTGKELFARAIHNSSSRKDKLMVKINCAAMPVNLIESELFGHEKGSFTGAIERRIGKFELANEGTLFLDEIGEIPPDLQAKLLRAIQEREIERIGGKTIIKVNVRIIAATNRNLQKEVHEGRFRSDLFYRLNVFPISLPSLRERKEDIPVLVSHFINKFSKNTGKKIKNISGKAMKELMAYSWPGNVRELEHLVERIILTTPGNTIKDVHLPTGNVGTIKKALEDDYVKSFEENERDHIIRVLNKCKGKIYGPGGAAEILGLRASTLNSKIKKLKIEKKNRYSVNDGHT